MKQLLRNILYTQGIYFIILGMWPVVSGESFMLYTGPKTDIWLMRTLGAILACEGVCFLITGSLREIAFPVLILAIMNSALLLFIDVHYNLGGVLNESYLIDAFIEFFLLMWWVWIFIRLGKDSA